MLNSALTQLLELEDDLHVIGSARDGKMAWADLQRLRPQVAILDIEIPGMSGLDVADHLQVADWETKVVILTTFAQQAYFERAVKAQVAGYLLKDSPSDDLIDTVRQVMQGKTIYAPELVVNMFSAATNPLTDRELAVLTEADKGLPTKTIAANLYLSAGTVRNYLSAIFSKLGVHNRLEAIKIAKDNKWLT